MSTGSENPDEEPDPSDDNDDDDEDDGDGAGTDPAREPAAELFAPPADDEYREISLYAGLEQLPAGFPPETARFLRRRLATSAVRFSGGETPEGGLPALLFAELVIRAARVNRWVSNRAAPGEVGYPAVQSAPAGSLIVHFLVSPFETGTALRGDRMYPSAYGARAIARLLAYSEDEDRLLSAVRPLGKRAVRSYIRALDRSSSESIAIDWLTREGQFAHVDPRGARHAVEVLQTSTSRMVTRTTTALARVDRPSHGSGQIRLEPLRGRPMTASFDPNLREDIRLAWGRYAEVRILVHEAENPSLPRAPRRQRTLVAIGEVYDPEDLPDRYIIT